MSTHEHADVLATRTAESVVPRRSQIDAFDRRTGRMRVGRRGNPEETRRKLGQPVDSGDFFRVRSDADPSGGSSAVGSSWSLSAASVASAVAPSAASRFSV
jgi:hypothetical protein